MDIADFSVVDLFCGVGGLTHGFTQREFFVAAGVDFDSTCEFAYEYNNGARFIHADVKDVPIDDILSLYPEGSRKILVGCAPCQPFSSYTAPRHKKEEQWSLLNEFGRLVEGIRPDIVSMENVSQLRNFGNGEVFDNFVDLLRNLDYHVWFDVVKAQDYGVPQSRRRLVLLASRLGPIELLPGPRRNGDYVSLREAIGDLAELRDGEVDGDDPLHRARLLSDINRKRIRATPEGGSWVDWDESLVLDCHKKDTGKTYKSVYGRMRWDDVAPTMTTQCTGYGNGRFGHPEQHRAISLREAAIIQSFPRDYQFINPSAKFYSSWIQKHIGNAVPVGLAQAIALSIENHIENHIENIPD